MNFKIDIDPNIPNLCPKKADMFKALALTPLNIVKVVILGQDPYHQEGLATGLAFSVEKDKKLPASLRNIFIELKDDTGIENTSGDLTSWATQGVLLLNTVLTTEVDKPGAHFNKGWEKYTDTVIEEVSREQSKVIFLLWGKKAQEKESLIDQNKHVILKASHPSPYSVHDTFFGCKHFSKANEVLKAAGLPEIDWRT